MQSNLFNKKKAIIEKDISKLLQRKKNRDDIKAALSRKFDPLEYELPTTLRSELKRKIEAEGRYQQDKLDGKVKDTTKSAWIKANMNQEAEMLTNALAREKALTMSKKITMQSEVKFTEYFMPADGVALDMTYVSSNILWCKVMYALAFLKKQKLAKVGTFDEQLRFSGDINGQSSYISLAAIDTYMNWLNYSSVHTIDVRSEFKYEQGGKDVVSRCETYFDNSDARYINSKMINKLKGDQKLKADECTAVVFFRHFGKVFQAVLTVDSAFVITETTEQEADSYNQGAPLGMQTALIDIAGIQFVKRNIQKTANGFYEFQDQQNLKDQFLARNDWKSQNLAKYDSIVVKIKTKATEFLQNDVYFNTDINAASVVVFKLSTPIRYVRLPKNKIQTQVLAPFANNIITLKNAINYGLISKIVNGFNEIPQQVAEAVKTIADFKYEHQTLIKFIKAIKSLTKAVLNLSRGINTGSINRCVKSALTVEALYDKRNSFLSVLLPLQTILAGYSDSEFIVAINNPEKLDLVIKSAQLFLVKGNDSANARKTIREGLKTLVPFINLVGQMFFDTDYDDMSIQNYTDLFNSEVVESIRIKVDQPREDVDMDVINAETELKEDQDEGEELDLQDIEDEQKPKKEFDVKGFLSLAAKLHDRQRARPSELHFNQLKDLVSYIAIKFKNNSDLYKKLDEATKDSFFKLVNAANLVDSNNTIIAVMPTRTRLKDAVAAARTYAGKKF